MRMLFSRNVGDGFLGLPPAIKTASQEENHYARIISESIE
jgi:hypothetical protein